MFRIFSIVIILFQVWIGIAQDAAKATLVTPILDTYTTVRDFALSRDGTEAYFTIQSMDGTISQLASMKKTDGEWQPASLLHFCDKFQYLEPFLSQDDNRLYFVSNRPINISGTEAKDYDIWFVQRKNTQSSWSEPIRMEAPVNSERDEFYPSIAENGNLYFTMVHPDGFGKDDLYVSTWNGNKYEEPTLLPAEINSEGYEFNAFIATDESFLLFTKYNTEDGLGSGDLYVSKRDANGSWQKAENLGPEINSKYMEYCPYYDNQTKTLYFTSRRNDLMPKNFTDIEALQQYLKEGANGQSKVYQVKINLGAH